MITPTSVTLEAAATSLSVIREELCARRFGEARTQQEVAIADDDRDRNAGVGDAAQSVGDARGEGLAQLIVPDPLIEEITQQIHAGRIAGGTRAERFERRHQRRARRRQVEVGEEKRRLYATSSARVMTTSCVGTFW